MSSLQRRRATGAFDAVGSASPISKTVAVLVMVETNRVIVSVYEASSEKTPAGISGANMQTVDFLSNRIYRDYSTNALTAGKYQAAPAGCIAGVGLNARGLRVQNRLSARKTIVPIF